MPGRVRLAIVRRSFGIGLVIAVLMSIVTVTNAESSDESQIRATREASNRAIEARDLAALANTWLPELHVTTSRGRVISGGEGMLAAFGVAFSEPGFVRYRRIPGEITLSPGGSLAAEEGHWQGLWETDNGELKISGVYLAQWHKRADGWKIRSELFVALECTGGDRCASQT